MNDAGYDSHDEDGLHLSYRLECGHRVEASEDSGGMDELPRVTFAIVERLLDFKINTHNCERFDTAAALRARGKVFG